MTTPEISPCPDRILDNTGGAFFLGAVGGSPFHFLKGIYNSPKGERWVGGIQAVRMNAPRIGGSFAVYGGLFTIVDCTMVYMRQKEDPWNIIISGAATRGFLQMRQGLGAVSRSALFGGVFWGLIEGAGIMTTKMLGQPPGYPQIQGNVESTGNGPSSWFGGLFGGDKEESKTKILESFDAPAPPSFEYK